MRTLTLTVYTLVVMASFAGAAERMKQKPSEIDIKVMCDFLEYSGAWNQACGTFISL